MKICCERAVIEQRRFYLSDLRIGRACYQFEEISAVHYGSIFLGVWHDAQSTTSYRSDSEYTIRRAPLDSYYHYTVKSSRIISRVICSLRQTGWTTRAPQSLPSTLLNSSKREASLAYRRTSTELRQTTSTPMVHNHLCTDIKTDATYEQLFPCRRNFAHVPNSSLFLVRQVRFLEF